MRIRIEMYRALGEMAAQAQATGNAPRAMLAVNTCMHHALAEPNNADMRAAFTAYNDAFNSAIDAPANILVI